MSTEAWARRDPRHAESRDVGHYCDGTCLMVMSKGIFCLEGAWDQKRDLTNRLSVEQQLRMFEGAGICTVIHRDVATRTEFEHYLKEWLKKKYGPYPLGYLAFHGTRGALSIGGYTRQVDWMESAAFDCLLVPRLLKAIAVKPVFTSLERD